MTSSDGPRPRPYSDFQGEVGRTFRDSVPAWPDATQPRDDRPNIVVMLVDDMGYSDVACFGGEIPTPHLDDLAGEGLRFTNFHATPKCSPTRASLMTGIDHHLAGYADVVHFDPGYPNYRMELDRAPTLPGRLRDLGYATLMVGKWHLAREAHMSVDAPRRNWPLQRGFDEFYGLLDGFTSQHDPHQLVAGNTILDIDAFPPDYYLTDDLTAQAVRMLRDRYRGDATSPFFLYFAHAAVHAPLEATPGDLAAHAGRYDIGWDQAREERFRRQRELGIVAASTRLPSGQEEGFAVPAWSHLDPRQQAVAARYMETYAGMVTSIDRSVGRLKAHLVETGQWDNTIFLFLSDNGASSEGGPSGSPYYFSAPRIQGLPESDEHRRVTSPDFAYSVLERIGTADARPHYNWGWARLSNTPFRLFKKQTHAGGHQVPAILSWPAGLEQPGGLRRQYLHVTDILPTLLAIATGGDEELDTLDGYSFQGALHDEQYVSRHREQYYEMDGNRGMYIDGWDLVARYDGVGGYSDEDWELYDLTTDPTQIDDLAAVESERAAAMRDAWEETAWDKQVFPLTDDSGLKDASSPARREADVPVTLLAGASTLDRFRSRILVQMRSFEVLVELTAPHQPGDEGVLVSHGDQGGGYIVWVEGDQLLFAHTYGGRTRTFAMGAIGTGVERFLVKFEAQADGLVEVHVGAGGLRETVPERFDVFFGVTPFQGIDIGIDRRSPVSRDLRSRRGPFPYSGAMRSLTVIPGARVRDARGRSNDGALVEHKNLAESLDD